MAREFDSYVNITSIPDNMILLGEDPSTGTGANFTVGNLLDGVTIDGISDIPGLNTALNAKLDSTGDILISQVTDLQTELNAKFDSTTAGVVNNVVIIGNTSVDVLGLINERVADITGVSPTDGRIPGNVTSGNFLQFSGTDGTIGEVTAIQFVSDLGLNNVDNVADLNKPISTAAQTSLDAKVDQTAYDTKQSEQDAAIGLNTDKTGITPEQTAAITQNSNKNSYPTADSAKLATIENGADMTNSSRVYNILGITSGGNQLDYVAGDGSIQRIPDGVSGVTLDTDQTITGDKLFQGNTTVTNSVRTSPLIPDDVPLQASTVDVSSRTATFDVSNFDDYQNLNGISIGNFRIHNEPGGDRRTLSDGSSASVNDSGVLTIILSETDLLSLQVINSFSDTDDTYLSIKSTSVVFGGNVVDLNTDQTITGEKTFNQDIKLGSLTEGGGLVFGITDQNAEDNRLDDYEEGTWSPFININGGTPESGGGSVRYATYTKIGDIVNIQYRSDISVLGTGTFESVSGLPFAPATVFGDISLVGDISGSGVTDHGTYGIPHNQTASESLGISVSGTIIISLTATYKTTA